jgi:predicted enzyme related to lactoylglutathione lyase
MSDDLVQAMRRAQAEGGLPGVGLHVDDCRKTYEELSARGVEFLQEPADRPYGVEALMRDNSGNWMVLVEPKEYTAHDFDGAAFE